MVEFEVEGIVRFTIGDTDYEVPLTIPLTWTAGGAA